jgi:hypothetical protein
MTKQVNHFINGRRTAGRSGCAHAVHNPATGPQSGSVDLAGPDEEPAGPKNCLSEGRNLRVREPRFSGA